MGWIPGKLRLELSESEALNPLTGSVARGLALPALVRPSTLRRSLAPGALLQHEVRKGVLTAECGRRWSRLASRKA